MKLPRFGTFRATIRNPRWPGKLVGRVDASPSIEPWFQKRKRDALVNFGCGRSQLSGPRD